MTELVLASTSAPRKALLSRLELPFVCVAPEIDETPLPGEGVVDLVGRLSQAKAQSPLVLAQYSDALVIGCDQLAECGEQILGKPLNYGRAFEQLSLCSGTSVTFHSGLCLFNTATGACQVVVEPTVVVYRVLSEVEIKAYLERARPYQCAGAMLSEGLAVGLVERIESADPNALMGLPLIKLAGLLRNQGVNLI